MRRFVTLNCLVDKIETEPFPSDAIQNLRDAVLIPFSYKPILQQALQNVNFKFHRTCSLANIIRDCNVCEGETLLMFWGSERSESRVTMSMSTSSCSSNVILNTSGAQSPRDRELRSIAQQTDISCRYSSITSPESMSEAEERATRARLADSLTFSPASISLPSNGHSMSILGSVCALLLNKQIPTSPSSPKEVSSFTGSVRSENICRICFGGSSAERLVRPCSCRGTIASVHRSCLERWLLQAATSYCELCRHHYVVTRSHKWSWASSLAQWAMSGRGRALAADAWRAVALGAASVLGTARALHACDAALQAGARRGGAAALAANLFSSLLIGVIGALNGLLTTWMLLKIQEHQASWRAWRDSTLHVHVTLGDESRDTVVQAIGAGTGAGAGAGVGAGAGAEAGAGAVASRSERSTNVPDDHDVFLTSPASTPTPTPTRNETINS